MRYLIRPLDLKGLDKLIYEAIYEKIYDYESMEAKYTYRQIAEDIRLEFKLEYNPKQIMKSINNMIESGYLQVLEKGKKGTPTTFKIIKIEDIKGKQIDYKYETNRQQINVEISTCSKEIETNKQQIRNTLETPYNKKNNKEIYIDEIWNLYPKKQGKAIAVKKIPNIVNSIGKEKLIECIENYIEYVEYTRENSFKLEYMNGSTFFNGRWEDYLEKQKAPIAVGGTKNNSYNSSICKKDNDNTEKIKFINNFR
ncbi:MAG: hypothetical protein ACRCX2_37765 [Paraclostridium sp.]